MPRDRLEGDLIQAAGWRTIRPGLALATPDHLEVDRVAQRTQALADRTGRAVSANGSWSTGGAFAPHADAEEACILQVAGRWHQAHTQPGDGRVRHGAGTSACQSRLVVPVIMVAAGVRRRSGR